MVDTIAPHSAEELADVLRAASRREQPVVPWGAGTLQHLGAAAHAESLIVRTAALNQIVEYNPADLTITAEGGATLGDIQATLGAHGQWLPWDPPAPDAATLGGLLAAGVSGPLRLGYGTPRDWVLGMRVALGDGRLVKSGGKVVKNVAGYETHKLHLGAIGTLGVIVAATLKVAPLPERAATLVFNCHTRAAALALSEQLRAHPLAPASLILIREPEGEATARVAVRFAGVPAVVERQLKHAREAASAAKTQSGDMGEEEARALWERMRHFAAPAMRDEVIIQVGTRPRALAEALEAIEKSAPAETRLVAYPGVGLIYARWRVMEHNSAQLARAIAALRSALLPNTGYVVVEDAPAEIRPQLDLWGPAPPTLALMRALKAQWDPQAILNRGRYLGGL